MASVTKETILEVADLLFSQNGVGEVSIDDICRNLCISKKTFYQYYPQKEDLICDVLSVRMEKKHESFRKMVKGKTTVEFFVLISNLLCKKKTRDMDKTMFQDVEKYYPETFQKFTREKSRQSRQYFDAGLMMGKKEGSIREDIDPDTASLVFGLLHRAVVGYVEGTVPSTGKKVPFKSIVSMLEAMFVRTLLTEEGLREYEKLKAKETL